MTTASPVADRAAPRRPAARRVVSTLAARPPLRSAATPLLAAGAGLIITTAAIHLHLYLVGYRHVPTLGVLFMIQAVAGFALGAALLAGRHLVTAAAGAGYMAASAAGLILSATVGFVGVHDSLGVPWATTSLVVELIGLVLLGVATVSGAGLLPRRPRAGQP